MGNCVSQKILSGAAVTMQTMNGFNDGDVQYENDRQSTDAVGQLFNNSSILYDNIFHVSHVNRRGKVLTGNVYLIVSLYYFLGTMEVTETEIILRRSHHESMRWPLHYLRRYGYEDGVFSFESGRRCSSGEGVFMFRCVDAERLFLLVQMRIQENASHFPSAVFSSASLSRADHRRSMLHTSHNGSLPFRRMMPIPRRTTSGIALPPLVRSPMHRHLSEGAGSNFRSDLLMDTPLVQLRRPRSLTSTAENTIVRRDTSTTFLEADEEEEEEVFVENQPNQAYINVGLTSQTLPSARSMMKPRGGGSGQHRRSDFVQSTLPNRHLIDPIYQQQIHNRPTVVYRNPHRLTNNSHITKPYVNIPPFKPTTTTTIITDDHEPTPPLLDYAFVNVGGHNNMIAISGSPPIRSSSIGSRSEWSGNHNYAHIDIDKTKALEQTANGRRKYCADMMTNAAATWSPTLTSK